MDAAVFSHRVGRSWAHRSAYLLMLALGGGLLFAMTSDALTPGWRFLLAFACIGAWYPLSNRAGSGGYIIIGALMLGALAWFSFLPMTEAQGMDCTVPRSNTCPSATQALGIRLLSIPLFGAVSLFFLVLTVMEARHALGSRLLIEVSEAGVRVNDRPRLPWSLITRAALVRVRHGRGWRDHLVFELAGPPSRLPRPRRPANDLAVGPPGPETEQLIRRIGAEITARRPHLPLEDRRAR